MSTFWMIDCYSVSFFLYLPKSELNFVAVCYFIWHESLFLFQCFLFHSPYVVYLIFCLSISWVLCFCYIMLFYSWFHDENMHLVNWVEYLWWLTNMHQTWILKHNESQVGDNKFWMKEHMTINAKITLCDSITSYLLFTNYSMNTNGENML